MSPLLQPSASRPLIAIIGKCNSGKSSLFNALTGQNLSIVSEQSGTTTDAVSKIYELIPFGPVTFYDTAGLDDTSELGKQRIQATQKVMARADLILYVIGDENITLETEQRLQQFSADNTNFIPVFNFVDKYKPDAHTKKIITHYHGIQTSATKGLGLDELKKSIIEHLKTLKKAPNLLQNLIKPKDIVILVTPIDLAAPAGRLILPQVQTIREILDNDAITLTVKVTELNQALALLKTPPSLVITDSQAVKAVADIVPNEIPLVTFSMLFARAKGNFELMLKSAEAIKNLQENDKILIAEGCSHHITCDDIGRVKIPALLHKFTGKNLKIDFVSGFDFPDILDKYKLIIHCGGCMLNQKEISHRIEKAKQQNIPITNYGMVISLTQGVLERTSAPLSNLLQGEK